MSRYYSIQNGNIVHLSFSSHETGVWPHLLCNASLSTPVDVTRAPTCLLCIGTSYRYDESLNAAYRQGYGSTNPCAEIWLGGLWSSGHG